MKITNVVFSVLLGAVLLSGVANAEIVSRGLDDANYYASSEFIFPDGSGGHYVENAFDGKQVVDCNEAYTSKTRSWSGEIDDKLGGKKVIQEEGFKVNRDLNGSRNILIKHLTRVA